MGASEEPDGDAERVSEEDEAGRGGAETPDGGHEVPLFLRGRSDARQGNAQDEKDETGE
jgi:hypothetical protein